MNEHHELIFAQASLAEGGGIVNRFHGLYLGEVIAAADGAEIGVKGGGGESGGGEIIADVFVPRMFEVKVQRGPTVQFGIAPDEVRLE